MGSKENQKERESYAKIEGKRECGPVHLKQTGSGEPVHQRV